MKFIMKIFLNGIHWDDSCTDDYDKSKEEAENWKHHIEDKNQSIWNRVDHAALPRTIKWDDELTYEIDKVTDIKQAASMRCGGQGDRYTIKVNGKETYLFFERNASVTGNNIGRWFVEGKTA